MPQSMSSCATRIATYATEQAELWYHNSNLCRRASGAVVPEYELMLLIKRSCGSRIATYAAEQAELW